MKEDFNEFTPLAEIYAEARAKIPRMQLWDNSEVMEWVAEHWPNEWRAAAIRHQDLFAYKEGQIELRDVRHPPDRAKLQVQRQQHLKEYQAD